MRAYVLALTLLAVLALAASASADNARRMVVDRYGEMLQNGQWEVYGSTERMIHAAAFVARGGRAR
jgi:hypothetical protein